jgi:hypothetical protein
MRFASSIGRHEAMWELPQCSVMPHSRGRVWYVVEVSVSKIEKDMFA